MHSFCLIFASEDRILRGTLAPTCHPRIFFVILSVAFWAARLTRPMD